MLPAQTAADRFDERFAAGLAALRQQELPKAQRAFRQCRELVGEMPAERQAAAAFAADLFLVETVLRAGQTAEAEVARRVAAVRAAAVQSGAWTAPRGEGLRLRALALWWRTVPGAQFRRDLDPADRQWLQSDDLLTKEPARTAAFAPLVRVWHLQLATTPAAERAALQALAEQEAIWSAALAQGASLAAEAADWRPVVLATLAGYHAERRAYPRAQLYVDRLPPAEALVVRAQLALQREDHAVAAALARELLARGEPGGDQLLAEALEAGGDPAQREAALAAYDRALAAATTPLAAAAAHNGRGDCLLALARLAEADAAYQAALAATDDSVGGLAERAEIAKDRGRLAERQGDAVGAFRAYAAALAAAESVRARLLHDPFGGSWLHVHADQTTALDGLFRTQAAAGATPIELLAALELGRARGAAELLLGPASGLDAAALQPAVAARLLADTPAAVLAADAAIERLRTAATGLPVVVPLPTAPDLQRELSARPATAVLAYWFGREQAWCIRAQGDRSEVVPLGPSPACRAAVAQAYAAVAGPDGDPAGLAAASAVLLPPALRHGLPDAVLVIPAPAMARVPWAALPVEGQPFGVGRAVAVAPSLAVASVLAARPPADGPVAVVAASEQAPLAAALHLDPLRFLGPELAAVAAAHPAAERRSSPTQPGAGRSPPRWLHLAAHAVACPGLPSQTVLLLDDGPWVLTHVGGLGLSGSEVVFGACGAAVGEQRGHEGSFGLVEGALGAGARAVLAPVAAVNQEATAALLGAVHRELAAGAPLPTALQRSMAWLAGRPGFDHPHYWGAFTVTASWPSPSRATVAPAASGGSGWWWWVAGLLALAGGCLLPRQQRRVGAR